MTEHGRLETALLYIPGRELESIADPACALHQARIDVPALARELRGLAAALRRAGAKVRLIPRQAGAPPNLMYVRDLFFRSPDGVVLARMGAAVRAPEPPLAARALRRLGARVLEPIAGPGRFEGADALWLDERTVVCGVGRRTNPAGFRQLRSALGASGVEAVAVRAPEAALHLLGALQIVDAKLALLRRSAGDDLRALLKSRGFRLIAVPETRETAERHGMNVIAAAPRRIIMPSGCPGLARLYRAAGLRVAAQLEASQLIRGGGGLACAAGIVSRARA